MIHDFRGNYNFLSNFSPSKVKCDLGLEYTTVEAAYQASKTTDYMIRKMFTEYKPKTAKNNGRKIKLRENWEEIKVDIMLNLLRQKFQDIDLRQKLIDTGDEELVEGNWWGDTFWGKCNGTGKNMLGELLMRVRKELKDSQFHQVDNQLNPPQ
jgi:N-glycosidase YbiA